MVLPNDLQAPAAGPHLQGMPSLLPSQLPPSPCRLPGEAWLALRRVSDPAGCRGTMLVLVWGVRRAFLEKGLKPSPDDEGGASQRRAGEGNSVLGRGNGRCEGPRRKAAGVPLSPEKHRRRCAYLKGGGEELRLRLTRPPGWRPRRAAGEFVLRPEAWGPGERKVYVHAGAEELRREKWPIPPSSAFCPCSPQWIGRGPPTLRSSVSAGGTYVCLSCWFFPGILYSHTGPPCPRVEG